MSMTTQPTYSCDGKSCGKRVLQDQYPEDWISVRVSVVQNGETSSAAGDGCSRGCAERLGAALVRELCEFLKIE